MLAPSCRPPEALAALEAEITLGTRPEDWYTHADRAIASLLIRFPGARERVAYRDPPSLSPGARRR